MPQSNQNIYVNPGNGNLYHGNGNGNGNCWHCGGNNTQSVSIESNIFDGIAVIIIFTILIKYLKKINL